MTKNLFLLMFILIFFAGCGIFIKKEKPSPEESPELIAENYVSDAIDYYQAEKYREAIDGWKRALEIIPDDAEVHNFTGLAYHRSGKLDSAIIYFERAVEIDTLYNQAWNNLGYMHFLQGEYEDALDYFDQALRVNPFYEQARLNRMKTAEILDGKLNVRAFELVEKTSKTDSLELRIMNYRRALEIDSNYVDAWNNLGVSYFYYGNLDSAVICFRRALDKKPDYPPGHNNVGYLLDTMGEYDQAIAHYQRAIELKPGYIIAMANLVDTYVHKKDYESARTVLDALRKIEPEHYLVKERIEDYQEILYGSMPKGEQ